MFTQSKKAIFITLAVLGIGTLATFFVFKKTNTPEQLARAVGLNSFYAERLSFKKDSSTLVITALTQNRLPVSLAGFFLETEKGKVPIPMGVKKLSYGTVNQEEVISLSPGEQVIIAFGSSPVGSSFLENKCTGYLNEFLSFTPPLTEDCPLLTLSGQAPDRACGALVEKLPACRSDITQLPKNTSFACRSFIADTASYNSCSEKHKNDPDFFNQTWRLFLPDTSILKSPTILLIDGEGKKVAEIIS